MPAPILVPPRPQGIDAQTADQHFELRRLNGRTANQRFELRMSRQLSEGLNIIADKEQIPRADVVRRALGLYARALEAEDQGQLIGFAEFSSDGTPQVVELIRLKGSSASPPTQGSASTEAPSPGDFARFELRLSQPLLDGIGDMADKEQIPRADVVRRALGLYARALEASAKGQMVAFANLHHGNAVEVAELLRLRKDS